MKYDIFISYRREGGYETAKHLYDLLTRDGYTVSFDIDKLRNGDFDKTLLNRIDECTDFILVLDAHAFDRTLDPSFPKENDWLRQELSYALQQKKNVIPIVLTGFSFPDDLPDDIVMVQRKNGPKYDKYYFDEFYKTLKTVFFETPVPKINTINKQKYDIFISYRREGGYETAKHLFDLLTRDGYTVSFDIDTLRNGDFDMTLLNRIDECTDFILVLDAHAFDRTLDPSFPKEKDWLYQELSYAMMKNKNIIPVLLSGFSFPDNLPDDIVKVQRKNGPRYDKYYFDEFYRKLKMEFFDTSAPKINAINKQNI